jgi:hypothetical protein
MLSHYFDTRAADVILEVGTQKAQALRLPFTATEPEVREPRILTLFHMLRGQLAAVLMLCMKPKPAAEKKSTTTTTKYVEAPMYTSAPVVSYSPMPVQVSSKACETWMLLYPFSRYPVPLRCTIMVHELVANVKFVIHHTEIVALECPN